MNFSSLNPFAWFNLGSFLSFFGKNYTTEGSSLQQAERLAIDPEFLNLISKSAQLDYSILSQSGLIGCPAVPATSDLEMLSKSFQRIHLDASTYSAIYDPIIDSLLEGIDEENRQQLEILGAKNYPTLSSLGLSFLDAFQEIVDEPAEESALESCHDMQGEHSIGQEFHPPMPPPGPAPLLKMTLTTEKALSNLRQELQQQIEKMHEGQSEETVDQDRLLKDEIREIERIIARMVANFKDNPIFLKKYTLLLKSIHSELKRNDLLEESLSSFTDSRLFNLDTSSKIAIFVKQFKGNLNAQVALLDVLKKSLEHLKMIASCQKSHQLANQNAILEQEAKIQSASKAKAENRFQNEKDEWLKLLPVQQFHNDLKLVKKSALFGALLDDAEYQNHGRYPLKTVDDLNFVLQDFKNFHLQVSQAASKEDLDLLRREYGFWLNHFMHHLPKGFEKQSY